MITSQQLYCPSTLNNCQTGYSSTALRKLFSGKLVSPYFNELEENQIAEIVNNSAARLLAISGVNIKLPLTLIKNKLKLAKPGEASLYLLKLAPTDGEIANAQDMPANEHLTLQIARQIYDIKTVDNGLLFLKGGGLALLLKRFDRDHLNGIKAQEDFATLMGFSAESHGHNFKNLGSYLDMAQIINRHVNAKIIELEKFFKLVLFNFLFSNSNAHLKNFSLLETENKDFILSPAYDLLNTELHQPNANKMALEHGLFLSPSNSTENGKYDKYHFIEFGLKMGLQKKRLKKTFDFFTTENPEVFRLIQNSYLTNTSKKNYSNSYLSRLKILNQSD